MTTTSRKSFFEIVRDFSPAWFSVTMASGIVSTLFFNFPYGNPSVSMKTISVIIFFFNLFLFSLFTVISLLRYTVFPNIWGIMIKNPVNSLYLATIPMGANTLITVAVNLIYKEYGFGGKRFLYTIWGLWWLDVAASALCCWGLIHVMIVHQEHDFVRMTSVSLFPTVPLTVASSSGGSLALALQPIAPRAALVTITFSAFMVSIGLTLVLLLLAIYLFRLIVHGNPPGLTVISTFLPIGACAQPGYSILLIGQVFKELIPVAGNDSPFLSDSAIGHIVYAGCVCTGFFLWSLTTMWLIFMILAVQNELRHALPPFKLPFWSMIFPMGVYANLTIQLYRNVDAGFFRVYGAMLATFTLVTWILVLGRTLCRVFSGQMFESPCIGDIRFSEMRFFRRWSKAVEVIDVEASSKDDSVSKGHT